MSTHTAIPGTKSSGNSWTAANVNDLPGGWIGYVEVTSTQGSITTEVDLTSLTVTVTVNTSRRIKITGYAYYSTSVAGDDAGVRIYESTTLLNSGQVQLARNTVSYTAIAQCVLTPSAGSHTYKLKGLRAGGTGNIQLEASATTPCYILVEDVGPA